MKRFLRVHHAALLATAVFLAACNTAAPTPTPAPSTVVTTARPATAVAATAAPTSVAATTPPTTAVPTNLPATAVPATVVPTTPVLSFTPNGGPAGTQVAVQGSGYRPGSSVIMRLGLPEAIGEVLTSATVDADGRWSATLVIPNALPSGDIIVTDQMRLVAMDDANTPLASAPFAYDGPSAVEADLPGPGWTLALESDANRDGITDRVYVHPNEDVTDVQFTDPRWAAVAVNVDAVQIVQRNGPRRVVLLDVDLDGVRADQTLLSFGAQGVRLPSAYLLALDPARGPLVNLLPYGAGGVDYNGPFSFDWNSADNAFRLIRS